MEPTHFESLFPDSSSFDEVGKILNFIKEGNSCQILSFPGVGRSNLLRLLSYNRHVRLKHLGENQKWFHFVLVDFSEIRKKPLFDATKFLFLNLVDSLRERGMNQEYESAEKIFKEALSYNDELVLFQGLKRTIDLLAIEKELTIVFLFDRFEEYVPTVSSDFFSNLSVLRSRAKYRFSVVFSLRRQLEDVLEPSLFTDFYEFFEDHIITLPICDKPSVEFQMKYIEKVTGKSASPEIHTQLLNLTNGHSKLTRLSLETVLSADLKSHENVKEFLLSQKRVTSALSEIWQFLTPSEQTRLLTFSESTEFGYLKDIGLVKNHKITIPLFKSFVEKQSPVEEKHEDLIYYDENTGDVKKGENILSEQLTSLEFRLLKYCMEHIDKVLEREEIIKAVWTDAKSLAGVTDQALDQLIFRLRKKIEDDPNNPIHLQTIKGRGFRFTP